MKRFLIMMFAAVCTSMLCANEAAVRKTVDTVYDLVAKMEVAKAAKYYHPKYVEKTSDGKTLTQKDVKKIIKVTAMLKKAIKEDSSLLEIMEMAASTKGLTIPDEQKQQIIAMQETEQGKQQTAMIRQQMRMAWDAQIAKIQNSVKTRKVTECTVKGNKATVKMDWNSPSTDKLENIQLELVKVKGKWLILKSTSTLAEKE